MDSKPNHLNRKQAAVGRTTRPVVVMGPSGSGKSTIAARLAEVLGCRWIEADDLHPESNRTKMAGGKPLTDADRLPWLKKIAAEISLAIKKKQPVVVTCSALKKSYREILRDQPGAVCFIDLQVSAFELEQRLKNRTDHFFNPALLASQINTYEASAPEETDVISVEGELPIDKLLQQIIQKISR